MPAAPQEQRLGEPKKSLAGLADWFINRLGGNGRADGSPGGRANEGALADERERIERAARVRNTTPILVADHLKYERMQPLDDRLGDRKEDIKSLLEWVRRLSSRLCVRLKSVPEGTLAWIITDDPDNPEVEATQSLLELKGWTVEVHPATRDLVERATERDEALTPTEVEQQFRSLLAAALARGASDIHFEIRDDRGTTRFRINGEMVDYRRAGRPAYTATVIEQFGNYMFNRLAKRGARQFVTNMALNASAQMKIRNQTGHDQTVSLRFATAPDIRGVDIFVRVWRPDQEALTLLALGYTAEQIALLDVAIRRPYGVIVFSGPTGSGKSSSLTALLDGLSDEEKERRKVVSLEEPVERELEHVTHVSVSSIVEHGGWKTLLGGLNRWDSNINVLGEVKDQETAEAIMDLATSGKLSLTTVHAANVLAIPSRLEDLGVDHKLLYDAYFLVLLVNQGLVPRLCSACRVCLTDAGTEFPDNMRQIERFRRIFTDPTRIYVRGKGCEGGCGDTQKALAQDTTGEASERGTGIVGRVLLAEMVLVDDESREYIRRRDWDGWREWLEKSANGWSSIADHARRYLYDGLVDPADIERLVCPLDDGDAGRIFPPSQATQERRLRAAEAS